MAAGRPKLGGRSFFSDDLLSEARLFPFAASGSPNMPLATALRPGPERVSLAERPLAERFSWRSVSERASVLAEPLLWASVLAEPLLWASVLAEPLLRASVLAEPLLRVAFFREARSAGVLRPTVSSAAVRCEA
jgi:hypothetical protein